MTHISIYAPYNCSWVYYSWPPKRMWWCCRSAAGSA